MTDSLITFAAFIAGTTACYATWTFLVEVLIERRSRIARRFREEFFEEAGPSGGRSLFRNLDGTEGEENAGPIERMRTVVRQAGLEIDLGKLVGLAAGLSFLVGVVTFAVSRSWLLSPALAIASATLPFWWIVGVKRARHGRLRGQLPEAFDMMSRSIRGGNTMAGAFRIVGSELPAPLGDEFKYCCEREDLGLPRELTLEELAARNDLVELRMFVVALKVQWEVGGNPVEVLDNLSGISRKREKLERRVRALTAEGRMQAIVLSILPMAALAAIMVVSPAYAMELLVRPMLLGGILLLELVGFLWIRRIVAVEY